MSSNNLLEKCVCSIIFVDLLALFMEIEYIYYCIEIVHICLSDVGGVS